MQNSATPPLARTVVPPSIPLVRRVFLVAFSALFATHFAITWIGQMPGTLLGVSLGNLPANAFHARLFPQSWALFAPDPSTTNRWFEFQCRHSDGTESPWLTPHVESSMLKPSGYLERVNESAITWLVPSFTRQHVKIVESTVDGPPRLLAHARSVVGVALSQSHDRQAAAYRLAEHYCHSREPASVKTDAVRCRVLQQKITPYSRRKLMNKESTSATATPWLKSSAIGSTDLPESIVRLETCAYFKQVLGGRFSSPDSTTHAYAGECEQLLNTRPSL